MSLPYLEHARLSVKQIPKHLITDQNQNYSIHHGFLTFLTLDHFENFQLIVDRLDLRFFGFVYKQVLLFLI